jgi:hypothetical protein
MTEVGENDGTVSIYAGLRWSSPKGENECSLSEKTYGAMRYRLLSPYSVDALISLSIRQQKTQPRLGFV